MKKKHIQFIFISIIFLYFFSVFDINFHGADEPFYIAYTASIVEDGDLNIVNHYQSMLNSVKVTQTYNVPTNHSHGGVILWAPFYMYARFIYSVSARLGIPEIAQKGFESVSRCAMSFSTLVFGILTLFFTYYLGSKYFSKKVVLFALLIMFFGTPFFYYMLFEVGHANIIASLFAVLSIFFFSYALGFTSKDWFLYGMFFSVCVAVKTELLFHLLFIIPFFIILLRQKITGWRSVFYFICGAAPVTLLRAINSYIKYGVMRMEEFYILLSIPYPTLSFYIGLFRGVLYTSPILFFCFAGFVMLFFNVIKERKQDLGSKKIEKYLMLFLGGYVFFKMLFLGFSFTPAGEELSMRIFLADFPIFVLLLSIIIKSLNRKSIIYCFVPVAILFTFWNFMVMAEYLTGTELLHAASNIPGILLRGTSFLYTTGLFINFNRIGIKLAVLLPLLIFLIFAVFLLIKKVSKNEITEKRSGIKLLKYVTLYTAIAYLSVTALNAVNNKNNVRRLKQRGFFENARVIEISPFSLHEREQRFSLLIFFNYLRYLALRGDAEEYMNISETRRTIYGDRESSFTMFSKPEKPYQRLAEFYRKSDKFDKAIEFYEKMLKFNPSEIEGLISLGDLYELAGNYDKALKSYARVLEVNPNSINAYARLADMHQKLGNNEEAIFYNKKRIELIPENITPYLALGDIYNSLGVYSKAKEYYKKTFKITPRDADLLSRLGSLYRQGGELDKALEYYSRALELRPGYDLYMSLGDIYRDRGDYDNALEYYSKADEASPGRAETYLGLAGAYENLSERGKAAEALLKALESRPRDADLLRRLGSLYRQTGETDKALEYYGRALELRPGYDLYMSLGDIYRDRGDYDKALEYYSKADEASPGRVRTYREIAGACVNLLEHEKAAEALLKALESRPRDAELLRELAYVYSMMRKYDVALKYSEIFLEVTEGDSDFHYHIGRLYLLMGKTEEAFEKAEMLRKMGSPGKADELMNMIRLHSAYQGVLGNYLFHLLRTFSVYFIRFLRFPYIL